MKYSVKDIEDLLTQYQPKFILDENCVSHVIITEGNEKTPIPQKRCHSSHIYYNPPT